MSDEGDRKKLQRAMARLVAHQKQLDEHRKALRKHGSHLLDANVHAVGAANKAMADPEQRNILTHRYLKTQLTEGSRLRAIEGRGEKDTDTDSDADTDGDG